MAPTDLEKVAGKRFCVLEGEILRLLKGSWTHPSGAASCPDVINVAPLAILGFGVSRAQFAGVRAAAGAPERRH
jgi:hypothetical protein